MADHESVPERSLLARIFISSGEPRLRAGWRLLIHTILLVIIGVAIVVPLGIIAYLLGAVDTTTGSIDLDQSILQIMSAVVEVVVITAATWPARRFLDRRTFTSLGFRVNRHTIPDLLFGIALGSLLMALIYAFESLMGWLRFENWAWEIAPVNQVLIGLLSALILYLAVGYAEELLSRGYHLQNLRDGLSLPLALLFSSAVFGLLHLGNPNVSWISTLGIVLAGFFLAYGWIRTRELWIPIGLHIGWNFFQGTIFGFPVSGTGGFHLIEQSVDGPVAITGGAFGPEAGLVSWVAMLLGVALIWLYTRNRTAVTAVQPSQPAAVPSAD